MPRGAGSTKPKDNDAVETVTIPGVELVRAGNWPAVSGDGSVTLADLQEVVEAENDPAVPKGAIHFGHFDKRFGTRDGQPAMGWVENLRISGDKLLGDFVDVPRKLARILPKAFRHRSVEISGRVQGSARLYRRHLSGLALLGVTPPAVTGLADIEAIYAAWAPDPDAAQIYVANGLEADPAKALLSARRAAFGLESADDRDQLLAALDALAGVSDPTIHAEADSSGKNGGGQRSNEGGGAVAITEERLRELLKAKQDEDLEAKIASLVASASGEGEGDGEGNQPAPDPGQAVPATEPGNTNPTAPVPGTEGQPAGDGEQIEPGSPPAEGSTTTGTVPMSPEVLAQLLRDAKAGAGAAAALQEQAVESELVAAMSAGKITPAEKDEIKALLIVAPEQTRALLSKTPQRFSAEPLGGETTMFSSSDEEAGFQSWESKVFGDAVTFAGQEGA